MDGPIVRRRTAWLPLLAGLGHASQTDGLEEVVGFDLVHVLTADGFLMCRYVRDAG